MRPWLALTLLAGCTAADPTADPDPGDLMINEVAAAGTPHDWFEVVNAGAAPIALDDFVFVDERGELVRARRFDEVTFAPGQRHVQEVIRGEHGFQLGDGEELWIYRHDDRADADHVSWRKGASTAGRSYARIPDLTGRFVTTRNVTRGVPNPAR